MRNIKLFTLAVALISSYSIFAAVSATHQPGTYESATGYNVPLTTYNNRSYETYFISFKSSKVYIGIGKSYVTDAQTPCLPGFNGVANGDITSTDGWLNINANGYSGSNTSPKDEFAVSASNNSTHYAQIRAGKTATLKIKGYDQFSFGGRDNGNLSSGAENGKQFVVTINGVQQTITHSTTDWNIWRFDLDANTEYTIVISGNGDNDNRFRAFSLRLPSAPVGPVAVTGVTLDKSSVNLEVNGTEQLTATVQPANADNKNVSWTSSNTAVATVSDNGLVTAIGAGTATITVTTEDGGKTTTCTVEVSAPAAPIPVTAISLSDATVSIGNTTTLAVTYTPADANTGKAITTWTSSNTAVATVANGVVTGVAAGTATITATTEGGISNTCTVTVNEVAVTGVSLDKTTASLQIGGTTTLTATVSPADATNKNVTWTTSDANVATVNNGTVTAVNAGSATITVTSAADPTKTASCAVTVTAGPPVPQTDLTTHVPEIYEAKEIAGGYGGTLRVVNNREYEVYYPGKTNSSYASVCVKPNTQKQDGITTNTSANYTKAADGWFEGTLTGGISNTSLSENAEFEAATSNVMHKMTGNDAYKFHVQGFDQFAFIGKDKKQDTSSDHSKPQNNQLFEVYIDDVLQPAQTNTSSPTVRRYDISTSEHVIEVRAINEGNSEFYAFSLRVAQEPRTKWLKGNDSTQNVLQTTSLKPVTYVTKYNSIQGAATELVWLGAEGTNVSLTKVQGGLTDTFLLGGVANCPVGTYHYEVRAYYNNRVTTSVPGSFKVCSDIKAQSSTLDVEVYQGEEMDEIQFTYYALSADDVILTWPQGQPAGISGNGSGASKYIIGGTPTAAEATYPYQITVLGADTTLKGSITVRKADYGNNPVLYLYKNDMAYNRDGAYKFLSTAGNRNLIARKTKADGLRPADQYDKYKWILISEDVDADNLEVLALARGGANLPVLNMKAFSYTPNRLDWGEPDNGSVTHEGYYMTVLRDDHPIFKAMNKKRGDRIQVIDSIVGRGLMPISVTYSGTLCLGTALTRDIDHYYSDGPEETFIHEIPAKMHNNQKYICLPIGTESSNYLTSEGKSLLNKTIDYLIGTQASVELPKLAITEFKIGRYTGNIDEENNIITIPIQAQDSDAMKAAFPEITLFSPFTHATPDKMAADGSVDFSNWHFGVQYTVSDYINKRV